MGSPQVGAWVRARREHLKLSIKRAHELAGVSRQTWYDVEAERHPPSTDTQRGVAEALQVGVDWYDRLMSGERPSIVSSPDADDALRRVAQLEQDVRDLQRKLVELEQQAAERDEGTNEALAGLVDRLARLERQTG